ncbi:hypothetical protein WR25_02168 [Diploscapter pachys]|uniref:Transmembrane protein INAFM2 n=1 Tax=Diploscapter pachys TaxID=2018661 RepID=A0A2A2KQS9_9BILA|nr:hypothetical protein WR25_02168 [Diploscapter pachys]
MNNTSYSARMRNRSNAKPVYTSDKRAKFTQRENKKWIRLLTVLGYVVCVSLPAIALSIYYVYIWDPDYISKFPRGVNINNTIPVHRSPILNTNDRVERELKDGSHEMNLTEIENPASHENNEPPNVKTIGKDPHLEQILSEGRASMESSAEQFLKTAPGG